MRSESHAHRSVRMAIALAVCSGSATMLNAQSVSPTQASAKTKTLQWSSGLSDTVRPMSPSQLSTSITQLAARKNHSRVLVHLDSPISDAQRKQLVQDGLRLNTSLGGTSYFATLDKDADALKISRSSLVSISQITVAQKLHPDLQAELIHPWMISQDEIAKTPKLAEMTSRGVMTIDELKENSISPSVLVVAVLHKDASRASESVRLAKAFNSHVVSQVKATNTLIMTIEPEKIKRLAGDDAVMWIEPPLPQMSTLNAENRVLVGANTLNANPYDLDGTGINVLVFDAGRMFEHNDFGNRLTIGVSDTDSISDHATHVGGTIGGDGSGNFNNRGMAPGVDLVSYGFEQEGGFEQGFLYTDPGDIESDYTEAIQTYGAQISNNSIGTNTAPNGYPCEWTGNYGNTSALIDAIVHGSTGNPFRVVWANGNERGSFRCQGDDSGNHGEFYSTAPPSCAKNHITVGSVDSDTDLISSFSSWGPTDDGRIKPDISAPGCQDGGDGGVTSTSSFGGYTTKCGTSMAAPTVTGISALILQQYAITFPDRTEMRNGTLKAILANTAVDRGNIGPDYKYGYGSIRGVNAIDTVIAENIIESQVTQGGVYRGIIIVDPGTPELRATIAWDDVPAAPNVTTALINDLDIRITDAAGNEYLPWTLDPSDPDRPAVQTAGDHLNNIEQVSIMNPLPGAYFVEVTGFNIAQGPDQSFGLVTSSTLINCSSQGIVGFAGNTFSCSGSTTIQVVDCDLNTSDFVTDTVDVTVSSRSQAGGFIVLTLVETAPESGTFSASLSFSDTGRADIQVSDGDALVVSYIDADDGLGGTNVIVQAQASIDCLPPSLLSTEPTVISSSFAQVNVNTDEQSTIVVRFGTAFDKMDSSVGSDSTQSSHSLTLEPLTHLSSYFYSVEATDSVGNMEVYDNNGLGYHFNTPNGPIPVYEFLTDDSNPGWETTGDWAFGQPSGNDDDPSSGFSGDNVYGYNLNGDYSNNLPQRFLTTQILDFSQMTQVALKFQRWLGVESSTWDHASIQIRIGGGSWQDVWDHNGSSFQDSSWTFQEFDISEHADGQSDVQIRWVMGTTDSSVVYSGWNIDDVVFTAVVPLPQCQADINADGQLNFFDVADFLDRFAAKDPVADFTEDGSWDFFDVAGFLDAFAAGCP